MLDIEYKVDDFDSFLDFLDSKDCWYNDLNERRKAHMDSYMTIPDYANIKSALNELKGLPVETWYSFVASLKSIGYLSPNAIILSVLIRSHFSLDSR